MNQSNMRRVHFEMAAKLFNDGSDIGNESVSIRLAQCWFPGLAISDAKILICFSNKIHGSNFIKQHSETVKLLWFEITNMLIAV